MSYTYFTISAIKKKSVRIFETVLPIIWFLQNRTREAFFPTNINIVKVKFEQILSRISVIDRDVNELNKIKSTLPDDRPYSSGLQLIFDKQITNLLNERNNLLEQSISNPPAWLLNGKNGQQKYEVIQTVPTHDADFKKPEPSDQDIISFIKALPKTEIHLHLEACVNKQTLKQMFKNNGVVISEEDFEKKYMFHDLNGFIQLFLFIQSAVKTPKDFSYMIDSLADYMRADNILYSEVFVAPTKFIQNGIDFEEMMEVIVKRIRAIKQEDGTEINILIDVSRTFGSENAMSNLNRVLKLKYPEVIGIGLGGAEQMGPAKDFESVFKKAKEEGLRTVVHAGEDEGPISIWDSINYLKVERIGHGTSAIQDPDLVEYLRQTQIPIEICLTSNVFTGKYVKKEENHPVRQYFDQGVYTCVNTDDPEIFDVNLSYEFFKMYRFLNFTIEELIELIKKGIYATFHPDKDSLWKKIESDILKIRKQHNL